jgi:hypothetical protein
MAGMIFDSYKQEAHRLLVEDGINYSDKNPKTAALLFNTLLKATEDNNEDLRSKCAAGLMLRYWSVFTTKNVGVGVDYDTKISYGWEGLMYAMKYKVWQDPTRGVNADQAAKKAIHTIFLQHNYLANLDKSKVNNFCSSIDEEVNESSSSDTKPSLRDTLADEADLASRHEAEDADNVRSMIQLYIDKKKLVEAIILDTIAFNDVEKVTKQTVKVPMESGATQKYTTAYREFWPFKCVQLLSKLPEDYAAYFGENYTFNPIEFNKALETVRAANNQKLYRYLRAALADAKTSFTY